MALKLTGAAAKNFALFVYAVLKDQKKVRGKTRLVRMLREQRPFKFFNVPTESMKDFVGEAKGHGLLFVPIRNKKNPDHIEVVVFADDASKVQRIYDNLNMDYVQAEAGSATVEQAMEPMKQAASAPAKTETIQTEQGAVEFEVGGFEDDFQIGPPQLEDGANFISGRAAEKSSTERSPSGPSLPSKSSSPASTGPERTPGQKPSVKQQLQEIRQEQAEKKRRKPSSRDASIPPPAIPGRRKRKKRKAGNAISTYPT